MNGGPVDVDRQENPSATIAMEVGVAAAAACAVFPNSIDLFREITYEVHVTLYERRRDGLSQDLGSPCGLVTINRYRE